MASFPGAIASFLGFTATHTLAVDTHAAQHNLEQAEIVAVQTKVGTGSSTSSNNTVLRGNGSGTSVWGQANLTTDVTGVLPVNNGGTGTTSTTGTGSVVFGTSPTTSNETLTGQPTISDFTNALHNHQNDVGGGVLNAANALQAGSVSFANLLSTIFSSQITSYANGGSAGGTFNYINLGGIKLLWGLSSNTLNNGSGGLNVNVTMPGSFFSSITAAVVSWVALNTTADQVININGATTSNIQATAYTPGSPTSNQQFSLFVVGT